MVSQRKSVVVTGMSWTTALGDTLEGVWARLLKGETGVKHVPSPHELRNYHAAKITSDEFSTEPGTRLHEIATHTLRKAITDAALSSHLIEKTWLVLGTSFGARLDEQAYVTSPLNQWATEIAAGLGFSSRYSSLSTACSSGSDALLLGSELIQQGTAEICICGGIDLVTDSKRLAHSALGTMSPTQLRSFDKHHDGTLLGEGAAFLVLENKQHAKERGHDYYANLRGCGSANDANGLTAPDPNGLAARLAIERSLKDAELSPDHIQLYNAHGSGTVMNDETEIKALNAVFNNKQQQLMVFATKGAFGHTLGATGAIEAIALIQALNTGEIPPIVGLESPENNYSFVFPYKNAIKHDARIGMSLTLGFGGFDTSLIFESKKGRYV